jgi:hypothetical protein
MLASMLDCCSSKEFFRSIFFSARACLEKRRGIVMMVGEVRVSFIIVATLPFSQSKFSCSHQSVESKVASEVVGFVGLLFSTGFRE